MTTPEISVIVLTWNGRDLLPACLQALTQQTIPQNSYEIIVIDNGSRDGSVSYLVAHWPQTRLIALGYNRGFSGGVNAGLYAARGRLLVLLNNDAVAAPDFLAHLTAPFQQQDQPGATAGLLTFAHRPELVASAGVRVFRNGLALDAQALQPVEHLPRQPIPVFGASGGAVCYRREALQDVGVFDEGFFAYLEDVDLAWRLRGRGWTSLLTPAAQATHIHSATGGEGSPLKNWLIARNRLRVLLRCLPTPLLLRDWPAILTYDLLAIAQAAARDHQTTITGRLAALRELPLLLQQRRLIQARYTAKLAELDCWLEPALAPLEIWRQSRRLAEVLKDRPGNRK